jgi:hypothetical protein
VTAAIFLISLPAKLAGIPLQKPDKRFDARNRQASVSQHIKNIVPHDEPKQNFVRLY